jgi:hypothetical protein
MPVQYVQYYVGGEIPLMGSISLNTFLTIGLIIVAAITLGALYLRGLKLPFKL